MRVTDKPLPGDFVIRTRLDRATVPVTTVFIKDPSVLVWFDHAREHEAEQLEDVTNEPV
jgi:hypothetical protein